MGMAKPKRGGWKEHNLDFDIACRRDSPIWYQCPVLVWSRLKKLDWMLMKTDQSKSIGFTKSTLFGKAWNCKIIILFLILLLRYGDCKMNTGIGSDQNCYWPISKTRCWYQYQDTNKLDPYYVGIEKGREFQKQNTNGKFNKYGDHLLFW